MNSVLFAYKTNEGIKATRHTEEEERKEKKRKREKRKGGEGIIERVIFVLLLFYIMKAPMLPR